MTYKSVIILQLILYFSVTCLAQYYYPTQYRPNTQHGRRYWNNSTKNKTTTIRPNQVRITLYYETLCPASVDFLINTLRPTIEKLGPYLYLHLVPYGHAQTRYVSKRYKFDCQHGPQECYGNRLHACAIDAIRNNTKSALFNVCLVENTEYREGVGHDFNTALNTCAFKMNVSSEEVFYCLNTRRGVILQKRYGEETRRLRQLEYVPYVLINGKENALNEDLITVICRELHPVPDACPHRGIHYVTVFNGTREYAYYVQK